MTTAVCVYCGSIKFGAFNPCQDCSFIPESDIDMAYSMAITDHYFDEQVLNQISQSMKSGKPRPSLPPEQEEQFLNAVRNTQSKGLKKLLSKVLG